MGPVSSPHPSDGVLYPAAVPLGPCRTIEVPTFAVAGALGLDGHPACQPTGQSQYEHVSNSGL